MFLRYLTLLGSIFPLLGVISGATIDPQSPIFTTSSTLVPLGTSFTARCSLRASYTQPSKWPFTFVNFWRDRTLILLYDYPGSTRTPVITANPHNLTSISIRSLRVNGAIYEAEITPKSLGSFTFWCNNDAFSSLPVSLTVISSLPSASFKTNITKTVVGVPFQVSCTVSLFNTTSDKQANYSVAFFSTRDGRLATFEHRNGDKIALIPKHEHLLVQQGPRARFPVFELILIESKDLKQEYWCKVEELDHGTVESAHWDAGPVVGFTSVKGKVPNSWLGTCKLSNFETNGSEYSVGFWSDLGPKAMNQLAVYLAKPKRMLEFDTQAVPGWKEIVHVPKLGNLTFAIEVTGEASLHDGAWWCVLGVGGEGSRDYREIQSERVIF